MCENCIQELEKDLENCCIICGNYQKGWLCSGCGTKDSFAFGFYDQPIGLLATSLKQNSARHLALVVARLLADTIPEVRAERVVITPVPTLAKHRKERGVAHAEMVARELAKLKGWSYSPLLRRKSGSVQTGEERKVRIQQAKMAYEVSDKGAGKLADFDAVIIYDDITTTGATLAECARLLKAAGAKDVRKIVAARTR